MLALLAAILTAQAQTLVELSEGDTILSGCLEDPECGHFATLLLSETMMEVGLTLQRDPLASSALVNRGYGLVTEFAVDSVPVNRLKNDDGTRQTPVAVPLLPRLAVGYHVGSYTFDDPFPQVGVGAFLLPPIKVAGVSLASTGLDSSFAVPVYRHHIWVGADANYTFTQVRAQLIGTPDQLNNLGPFEEFVDPTAVDLVCELSQSCNDRYTVNAFAMRFGVAVDPVTPLTFYTRVGAAYVNHLLWIGWDETKWRQRGLQPQFQAGGGLRLADKLQLTAGTTLAWKRAEVSSDGVEIIGKVVGSVSYRWGQHRYWYSDARAVSQLQPEVLSEEDVPTAVTPPSKL